MWGGGVGEKLIQAGVKEQIRLLTCMLGVQHIVEYHFDLSQIFSLEYRVLMQACGKQKLLAHRTLEGDPRVSAELRIVRGKIMYLVAVKEDHVSLTYLTVSHVSLAAQYVVQAVSA